MEISKVHGSSLFEVSPYEGICDCYWQIRKVVDNLIKRLNESGHMQGTFLLSISV